MATTKTGTKRAPAKKTIAPKKAALAAKTKSVFTAELSIAPATYTATGATAAEAIDALVLTVPDQVKRNPKIKAVFAVTRGGRAWTRMMYPFDLRRFFFNKIFQNVLAKIAQNGLPQTDA